MSFFKSEYYNNGVDLAEYFPAYESFIYSQAITTTANSWDFTLNRNRYNTINYKVFLSINYTGGSTASNISTLTFPPVVYKKQTNGFSVYFRTLAIPSSWNMTLFVLVVYDPEIVRPIISSINNYNNVSSTFLLEYFPQYCSSKATINGGAGDYTLSYSLADKSTTSTTYTSIGSYEVPTTDPTTASISAGYLAEGLLFYTEQQFSNSFTAYIRTVGALNVFVNTLTLYNNSIPNNNFTSNYSVSIGENTYNLTQLFPFCEYFEFKFSNSSSEITQSFTLSKNTRNTNDYLVFPAFIYSSPGTGGTYGPFAASSATTHLIVINKSSSGFSLYFTKTTGQTWNGGLRAIVIYP